MFSYFWIIWKTHTAKTQYRRFETNILRKRIARPQSQFPHSCVCERFILYIPRIGPPTVFCCRKKCSFILGIYKSAHRHTNVEIRTEAEQFLFWKYINGFLVAVQAGKFWSHNSDIPQEESDAEGEEEERSYEKNTEFLNRNGKKNYVE